MGELIWHSRFYMGQLLGQVTFTNHQNVVLTSAYKHVILIYLYEVRSIMKTKSLRQMAKEMDITHSYLSQVMHEKRPASSQVVSKMVSILSNSKDLGDEITGKFYRIIEANSAKMVGGTGIEPVTSAMSTQRSNHLS